LSLNEQIALKKLLNYNKIASLIDEKTDHNEQSEKNIVLVKCHFELVQVELK